MISALRLHHFTRLQLAEGILEIGERTLRLPDSGVIPPEDFGVAGGLAEELGGLEDLAFGLDTLVDVLDLLVQFVRLGAVVSDVCNNEGACITMARESKVPLSVWRKVVDVQDRRRGQAFGALAVVAGGAVMTAILGISEKLISYLPPRFVRIPSFLRHHVHRRVLNRRAGSTGRL